MKIWEKYFYAFSRINNEKQDSIWYWTISSIVTEKTSDWEESYYKFDSIEPYYNKNSKIKSDNISKDYDLLNLEKRQEVETWLSYNLWELVYFLDNKLIRYWYIQWVRLLNDEVVFDVWWHNYVSKLYKKIDECAELLVKRYNETLCVR